ncbi:hypothetical protein SLS63_009690 [Diaporthe eres]|uniref:Zn(2)-C6 fungal-type domain-containing protein n=1 Tax=Diaporthe eres TaxID=83184 RepID=A0ABR1NYZ1_DIAER
MDGSMSGISIPSLQPSRTRKRACTSKVRTGCITCKERRVKCDEVKPTCLRCTRARQTCKGYMPLLSEPRPRKPEPVIRRLLPRQTASQSGGLAITVGRALPSIRLNGSDVLYFDFFRSEAVKELSGYLPSSFWSRIVLCETLTDSCIRHAILALGAASYPSVARNQHLPWSPSNDASFNAHGRAAICHHTKALALFREMMANGTDNFPSRSAFIVTPLLVAFTMLQSNTKAAETLLSGLKALQEVCHVWQGKQVRGGSKAKNLGFMPEPWQHFIYGLHPAPGLDTVYSRALKLVRLQYEILFIWASEALDRTRMGFDDHTARFESVVQDSAELLGHDFEDSESSAEDRGMLGQYSPAPQTGYTFESFGVVSVLGFVVTRCRVGPIRRRALAILERIWWRENGWDTIATNRGAKALMELEEQGGIRGADGELFIPAESRYYWGGARWENDLPASRKLICTFAQRRPDELGEVFGVPVVIDLSVPDSEVD